MIAILIASLVSISITGLVIYIMSTSQQNEMQNIRLSQIARTAKIAIERKAQTVNLTSDQYFKQKLSESESKKIITRLILASSIPASFIWYAISPKEYILKLIMALSIVVILQRMLMFNGIKKLRKRLEEELPRTLDLLVVCVEAGMSINSAIVRVAEESNDSPLAEELKYVFHELHAGLSIEEAFKHFAMRTKVPDIQSLSASIVQADKLGLNLGETLRNQAIILRETIRQRTRERVFKVPIKMLIPMVFLIFPAIFVIILGPGAISILNIFGPNGSNKNLGQQNQESTQASTH